jgi:protein gp37
MIFVNSMSDLFHEQIPDDFVASVFGVMVRAEHRILRDPDQAARAARGARIEAAVARERLNRCLDREPALRRARGRTARGARCARLISAEPLVGTLEGLVINEIDR